MRDPAPEVIARGLAALAEGLRSRHPGAEVIVLQASATTENQEAAA